MNEEHTAESEVPRWKAHRRKMAAGYFDGPSAEKDAPVRLVAMAVHEDICGCERGYRVHGRTYMETAHVVLNALGENGWRVIPLPDTFTIGTSTRVTDAAQADGPSW